MAGAVTTDIPGAELPRIYVDDVLMEQVLRSNLLENAAHL
jgi:K+-sensing histidine kinase KdpD